MEINFIDLLHCVVSKIIYYVSILSVRKKNIIWSVFNSFRLTKVIVQSIKQLISHIWHETAGQNYPNRSIWILGKEKVETGV